MFVDNKLDQFQQPPLKQELQLININQKLNNDKLIKIQQSLAIAQIAINNQLFNNALDTYCQLLQEDFLNETDWELVKAQINHKIADVFLELSLYKRAQTFLQNSVNVFKHIIIISPQICQEYALILAKFGKTLFYYQQCEKSLRFLLASQKLLINYKLEQSSEMGFVLQLLGNYYRYTYQDELSENTLKDSLRIRKSLHGINSLPYAESLHALAHLYIDKQQYSEGEKNLMQCIDIKKQLVGENSTNFAKSLVLQSNLFLKLDKFHQAQELVLKAYQINRNIVGMLYQETAECLQYLGKIKSKLDKSSDSYLSYFKESLKIYSQIYQGSHSNIAGALTNIGNCLKDRKQYFDAIEFYTKSIQLYKILQDCSINLAITLTSCADCNKKINRYREANRLYRKALKIYQNIDIQAEQNVQNIEKNIQQIQSLIED